MYTVTTGYNNFQPFLLGKADKRVLENVIEMKDNTAYSSVRMHRESMIDNEAYEMSMTMKDNAAYETTVKTAPCVC